MKNKTSFTIDILLCVTLISSLFYCLVTSFDIKTEWYIIVIPTAIFCTIYGLLASLVKKSGVLFISVAITMIVFVFTLLFSLESILEQLSYVITQALKLLSQYLPVQNKIILGDTLGTSATGLFVFISAILSAVFTISLIRYKRILIPSLLSMVLLVPCFILINTLPSLVCLFYCNCKSYCLVHFKEHTQIQTVTGRCDCGNFIRNNACCDDNFACVQSD